MWDMTDGKKVWRGGKTDYPQAAEEAIRCDMFRMDCEEECIDDTVSCYNCRYRRWTRESFICMKENRT